jgi:ribonuclease J
MPIHGEFHMLHNNAEMAEKSARVPRDNIFVCDTGDVLEIYHDGSAKKSGRIDVGGIMYDDNGEVVSEVVLRDRIHMSTEGIFVVILTVQRGSGRLLSSPDIISRGFIYLRDSEELVGMIRQYLKQKAAVFTNKHDIDKIKSEIRNDVTQILYDQTRRTPIVIPVINEVGGPPQSAGAKTMPRPTMVKRFNSKPAPKPSKQPIRTVPMRRPIAVKPSEISFKKKPTGPSAGGLWR